MKNTSFILSLLLVVTTNVYAQLHLLKTVTITDTTEKGSARPEIIASLNITDRVFVLYLGNIQQGNNRTFNLKIFNSNFDNVISSRPLVT